MRLSEAIRLGAMLKPQGFGAMFINGKTCANGAACDAVGMTHGGGFNEVFPVAGMEQVQCPACDLTPGQRYFAATIGGNIAHLNDDHKWIRERIADWVETVEVRQAADAVDPVPSARGASDCPRAPDTPSSSRPSPEPTS